MLLRINCCLFLCYVQGLSLEKTLLAHQSSNLRNFVIRGVGGPIKKHTRSTANILVYYKIRHEAKAAYNQNTIKSLKTYNILKSQINNNIYKFKLIVNSYASNFNPIESGMFQTVNDPGEGGFKSAPPPLHDIIHVHFTRCFRHVPIRIFQKFAILTI